MRKLSEDSSLEPFSTESDARTKVLQSGTVGARDSQRVRDHHPHDPQLQLHADDDDTMLLATITTQFILETSRYVM